MLTVPSPVLHGPWNVLQKISAEIQKVQPKVYHSDTVWQKISVISSSASVLAWVLEIRYFALVQYIFNLNVKACVYVHLFGFLVGFRLEDGTCLTLPSWALGSNMFCVQMQRVVLFSAGWFQLAEKIIYPRFNRYLPLAQGTMAWVFKACYLFQVQSNTYFLTTAFNIDPK